MLDLPEAAVQTQPDATTLTVSSALVTRFAILTGDQSRLHVDEAFARRSSYRRPVVHGMLPLSFLPLLAPFRVPGFRCELMALAARFSSPVFTDVPLTISVGAGRVGADRTTLDFDFQVETDSSARRHVVTTGTAKVRYVAADPSTYNRERMVRGEARLTPERAVNHLTFDEIETGATDSIDFAITPAAVEEFAALLAGGAEEARHRSAAEVPERFDVPTLLSMLLYSTSLGVSLPGASATFLEFSAQVVRRVELGPHRLRGRIVHRSAATRMVKKELLVTSMDGHDVLVRARAATLVAAPFRRMPSMREIREQGVDFGLRGSVVLITGASRGIGETTAKLFALHGAKVVVNYHRGADDAGRVVDEIRAEGGEAVAIGADVTNAEQVQALVRQTCEMFGTLDILVNNAARDFRPTPFSKLTWDEIQADIDVIVKGAFLCCQEAVPVMLERGGGKIINISTVATENPPPDQLKYVVAKSALVGLTRSLSADLASRNVQVNMVVPNFVETDLVSHVPEGFRKKIARDIPMRRLGSSLDVARAVVFLASAYSSFTTGQKVMVTGGGAPYL